MKLSMPIKNGGFIKRRIPGIISLFLILLITGCTTYITKTVEYKPSKKGVLSSFPSKSILIQIKDKRPVSERASISNFSDGFVHAYFKSSDPPPTIILNALQREFELNHHHIASDFSSNPDIFIKITLKRFYGDIFSGIKVARIDSQITVHKSKSADQPMTWLLTGNFKKTSVAVTGDCSEELNLALVDFIHNLTFDSRLIGAFQ